MTGTIDPADWYQRRTSFGSVAADYAAHRPGYPPDAVAFLLGNRPRRVLDLGAGTGLLTDVLVAAGHEVLAVDPSAEMLGQLSDRHPGIPVAVGGAEAIPLPDDDAERFTAEYAEALRRAYPPRPDGTTVLPFRRIFAVGTRPA